MDSIERLDAYVTDKPIDMEINGEGMDYMDEDPLVLMLRKEGTRREPPAIVEATTKLKNWAWKGAANPMEDSVKKIEIIKLINLVKKIKTIKLVNPAKNIVSISIEFVSASIIIPVESVCDHSPIESVFVKSVENSFSYNMISDSAYLLALNVFILKIGKETLNNKETRLLLDYYGSRLRSLCSEVPSMPSPWRSEAHATYGVAYHDFTLAILYMGNRYYWEDSPNNIQWP